MGYNFGSDLPNLAVTILVINVFRKMESRLAYCLR